MIRVLTLTDRFAVRSLPCPAAEPFARKQHALQFCAFRYCNRIGIEADSFNTSSGTIDI